MSSFLSPSDANPVISPLVLDSQAVRRCHIRVPDLPRPMAAIVYRKQYYSYVKIFPDQAAAEQASQRLINRGDSVILTPVRRGVILWVWEPDAQPASP